MKKCILSVVCVIGSMVCFAQLQSHVDERNELSSIVFRLADAEEYVNNEAFKYAQDIDAYFAPYKSHPLIQYVKKIREKDEIAYNAVFNTIDLLQIKKGKVGLFPQANLDDLLQDPRWTRESFLTYVELLNRFYKDSKFPVFFNRHKAFYAEIEKRFDAFLVEIHTEWFSRFFGQPLLATIYVSPANGRHNYGGPSCCSDTSPKGYISIGCAIADNEGIPVFKKDNFFLYFTIMHELCHIFTNPLMSKYEKDMMQAANAIFPYVEKELAVVAYGDAVTMLGEGVNNLCTGMYFREYPAGFEDYTILYLERRGFIWLRRAMQFMDNFYNNRQIYPYFEDFLPQFSGFFRFCGNHIEQILFEYNHRNPYIVNVFPSVNSVVSAGIKEIKIDFSRPMRDDVFGILKLSQEDFNVSPFKTSKHYWSEDKKTLFIPVQLEKNKHYGMKLPAGVYQTKECFPMENDFEIIFQTTK
jgi:hypothetical protein